MSKVVDAWDQLIVRMQSIAAIPKAQVVKAKSPKHLLEIFTLHMPPALGVAYEGLRPQPESGNAKIGQSVEIVFGLYLTSVSVPISAFKPMSDAQAILESMRGVMLGTRGPNHQHWRFMNEHLADELKGSDIWVQRWALPLPMVPAQ